MHIYAYDGTKCPNDDCDLPVRVYKVGGNHEHTKIRVECEEEHSNILLITHRQQQEAKTSV